ncbi:unnamed protein product [Orchesella dallaii]|uniref:DUF4789 domain-containing protein n=1 Tax=Orchesella dallaii TaxID=48710 RepID=A0ABP1RQG5_9HEXA
MTSRHNSIILVFSTIIIKTVLVLLFKAKSVSPQIRERIITDSEALIHGVPIDFSYNEGSTSSNSNLKSVPGCPKSDEGYPWVYYGSPKKCYLAGEQGPCMPDQSIFVTSRSAWGFCNCNCFKERKGNVKNGQDQFCSGVTSRGVIIEYVFKSSLRKCYTLFEQGPCNEGEWLVKTTGSTIAGQCEKRRCPFNQIPLQVDNNRNTVCSVRPSIRATGTGILRNQCGNYGLTFSMLRQKCVPSFSFRFDP